MYLDEDVIPSTCAHLEALRAPMVGSLPVNLKLMGINMRYVDDLVIATVLLFLTPSV